MYRGVRNMKKCNIVADRLAVPDNFVYGALIKRHKSKNSRHPYTIKKWLASDIEIKWSEASTRSSQKDKTNSNNFSTSKPSSLLLLDALEISVPSCSDDEVRKVVVQDKVQSEIFHHVKNKGNKFIYAT